MYVNHAGMQARGGSASSSRRVVIKQAPSRDLLVEVTYAVRMHLASVWLQSERLNVAEVAERLGYQYEAVFSRAFKRLRGVPPSALRRPPKYLARPASSAGRLAPRYEAAHRER